MKYFSMFSGIGGFEYGIRETSGLCICIGYSEIDKYASSIYRKQFPTHKNYGDATTINTADLPDFDLLVGGFPCQAFSVAGKRQGFMDARGTLFFEIARILADKRPRYFLFENVRGLLSHDGGKTIQAIFKILADIGYRIEWQVLNTKDYGIPQNRERIFVAGCLREYGRPEVFPIGETNRLSDKKQPQSVQWSLPAIEGNRPMPDNNIEILEDGQNRPLCKGQLTELTQGQSQGYRVYDSNGISSTLASEAGGVGAKTGLYKMQSGIRRLTPTECERLQGFPDGWTEYGIDENGKQVCISDTQRYKCLGNAVSTNVIQKIFEGWQ